MKNASLLDVIEIAAPCSASWEQMVGDDLVRSCESCRLNVYNLSGMVREEAERLVQEREGRLCVRFYRRADGTILTRDCPIGLRAIRRRLARIAASIVASIAAMVGYLAFGGIAARRNAADREPYPIASGPLHAFKEWLDPPIVYAVGLMICNDVKIEFESEDESLLETKPEDADVH